MFCNTFTSSGGGGTQIIGSSATFAAVGLVTVVPAGAVYSGYPFINGLNPALGGNYPIPRACMARDLFVRINAITGSDLQFDLYVNAIPTALTIFIPNGSPSDNYFDSLNSVQLNKGDFVRFVFTNYGPAASPLFTGFGFVASF